MHLITNDEKAMYLGLSRVEELQVVLALIGQTNNMAVKDCHDSDEKKFLIRIHRGGIYRVKLLTGLMTHPVFWNRNYMLQAILMNSEKMPELTKELSAAFILECHIATKGPENVPKDERWNYYHDWMESEGFISPEEDLDGK